VFVQAPDDEEMMATDELEVCVTDEDDARTVDEEDNRTTEDTLPAELICALEFPSTPETVATVQPTRIIPAKASSANLILLMRTVPLKFV
jgi:hypothetical protein